MRNTKSEPHKESERAKPVGIWIRVSTEDQARGESPEHHEKRAHYYAESKGWEVKEVYHLEAVSGKSVKEHPETQRMLKDIKDGRITGIIFSKLARLARNTRELLDFADIFREHNADLISLQESIDTSTPAGRLFYTIIAAMAQWEREEIGERVAASVPIRAKLGKPLGGAASFGYRWENKRLVPDETEGPVRKRMYELFIEHRRIKTVARLLNEGGHRTRNGSKFTGTTVERLLRDPTAKGLRRANYTKATSGAWKVKPEKDWIWSDVEAVVPAELWDQCNQILDEKKNGRRPSRKVVHIFAGVTYCHCGNKMYVPSNTPKYVCYKCRNKIPLDDLEGIFQEQLKGFFFSTSEISRYLEEADKTFTGKQARLQGLEMELRDIQGEMDKTYQLYLDDKITSNEFGLRYKPLEERKKQFMDQIPELQGEIDFLRIKNLSSDQILAEARDLYGRWSQLESAEKRQIVENIAEKITIGEDEVAIDLSYLPSSSKIMATESRILRDSWPRPA